MSVLVPGLANSLLKIQNVAPVSMLATINACRHADGAEALALAREFHPTAVSLDVFLPDMLGWTVLNHLKQDPTTRHIPVQMLTLDEDRHHGLARGAFSFVTKPTTPQGLEIALTRIKEYATPRRKRLLVVEDNPAEQFSIKELLGYDDIDVTVVSTGWVAVDIGCFCSRGCGDRR